VNYAKKPCCGCPHTYEVWPGKYYVCHTIGQSYAAKCRFPGCRVIWLCGSFYKEAMDEDIEFYIGYFKIRGYTLWVPVSRQPKPPVPITGTGYRQPHHEDHHE
jgi:hypothetical protein